MNDEKAEANETIYIGLFGSISEEVTKACLELIANKLPPEAKSLVFLMSTPGGDVSSGFVLYNYLRALPLRVVMYNVGSVDSIGNTIFLAGEERYTCANGTFLVHRVKGTTQNDNAEVSYLHEKLSTVVAEEKKIKKVFMERCTMPSEEFEARFAKGELQDAEYALKYGVVHEIRDLVLPPRTKLYLVAGSSQ